MNKAKIDIESLTISSILVVVAHPDDIESWCAGTICRFVNAGKHVCYVLCTSGDKGTSDPALTQQQVAQIREAEQIEAAHILGVDCVTFLHWPDSEVEATLARRRELVRQIRYHRPDIVITHDPVPPYRLHLLMVTQSAAMALAFMLTILALMAKPPLWSLLLIAALSAAVTAIDNPARQAFNSDLVGKELLLSAVALNASVYNGAAVIGPTLAGPVLLRVGAAGCFLLNAFSFLGVLVVLAKISVAKANQGKVSPTPGGR